MLSLFGPTLIDLGINVAANILAALILGICALAVLSAYRSRGVKKFFGVSSGSASMKIFLSTIAVQPRGTMGTAGIVQGFYGDAMTEVEYRHALRFASLLRSGSAAWIFTTILGTRAGADSVASTIERSPSFRQNSRNARDEVKYDTAAISAKLREQDCTVLIGGPIYNLLTHHILEPRPEDPRYRSRFFEFIREFDATGSPIRGIRTLPGVTTEDFLRSTERDYFIVSRVTIDRSKRVFICAGTCTCATAAAVDELLDWRQYTKFGDKDFGVLYRIHLPKRDGIRESEPAEAIAIEPLREF
ncbi:MAG: hypothetical protein ACRDTS_07945 [Mycobacterium sp.]